MVAVVALPAPALKRRRLAVFLGAALLLLQFGQTLAGFLRFGRESAGLSVLLAETEPGQNLAGLIFDRGSASWRGLPFQLHAPAYYQVEKGGRILFSFAELFHTSARFRHGQSWDDLLAEWNEWQPQRFDFRRHGGRFHYFLVRGTSADLTAAFGGDSAGGACAAGGRGEWWLLRRRLSLSCRHLPPRQAGSGVEHFLGKEGVTGSNPVWGSGKTVHQIPK